MYVLVAHALGVSLIALFRIQFILGQTANQPK